MRRVLRMTMVLLTFAETKVRRTAGYWINSMFNEKTPPNERRNFLLLFIWLIQHHLEQRHNLRPKRFEYSAHVLGFLQPNDAGEKPERQLNAP